MEIQIYWEFVQDKSKRMGDSGGDGLVWRDLVSLRENNMIFFKEEGFDFFIVHPVFADLCSLFLMAGS